MIHFSLMRALGETRYEVDFRDLSEPALVHSRNAAIYTNADIIAQAATLLFGLINDHSGRQAAFQFFGRNFGKAKFADAYIFPKSL